MVVIGGPIPTSCIELVVELVSVPIISGSGVLISTSILVALTINLQGFTIVKL